MSLKILQTMLSYIIVYVITFEDLIYVYGQISQEMIEQGRVQYQRLQERGNLPKYGNCWRSAVEHVEEGCRALSEESQSDMALHLTNCFLETSGHQTYNCVFDKKPNLRRICIMSMTDRAFNAYTEFYTHTQNICWFLRGQVWHETIAENTLRVGKQLETSARNQEDILKSQKESLALQEKLLRYGQNLEKIMEDFYISTQQHKDILSVMSGSLHSLQSWLVGELSWFDLVVFYMAAGIFIVILTSNARTAAARLPVCFMLVINAVIERCICAFVLANRSENEAHSVQSDIYKYVWWLRKTFLTLALVTLLYKASCYKDFILVNNALLEKIYNQNVNISERLKAIEGDKGKISLNHGSVSFISENNSVKKPFGDSLNYSLILNEDSKTCNYLEKREVFETSVHTNGISYSDYDEEKFNIFKNDLNKIEKADGHKEYISFNKLISGRQRSSPNLEMPNSRRYNLRSRHGTPESKASC